jgi:hypothetical protein
VVEAVIFFDMLPVLMSPELGGVRTTHMVGLTLRQLGCNAFVYPSARNVVAVTLAAGAVVDSRGWNLVHFGTSPAPQVRYKHYQANPWISPHEHLFQLSMEKDGPYRGTWMIKPPMPQHTLHMDLRYDDRLPVELLWPTPSDFPEVKPEPSVTEEELQQGDAFAMARMREEFLDRIEHLGPDHFDTVNLGNWLAENDQDWYAEFRKSH